MNNSKNTRSDHESLLTQIEPLRSDEVEIPVEDLGLKRQSLIFFAGDAAIGPSDEMSVDPEFLFARGDQEKRSRGRSPIRRETIRISLLDEIAPLISTMNDPMFRSPPLIPGPPLITTETRGARQMKVPPRSLTTITPNTLELPLFLQDDIFSPPGVRRQLLWTLLGTVGLGRRWRGSSRAPTIAERREGTFEAPLRFTLITETSEFHNGGPVWSNQRLIVTCEENDRIVAVRRQVALLCAHMREPSNLVTLSHHTNFV